MAKSSTVKKSTVSAKSSKKTIVNKTPVKSKVKTTKTTVAVKKPVKASVKVATKTKAVVKAPVKVVKTPVKAVAKPVVKPILKATPKAEVKAVVKEHKPVTQDNFDFKVNDYLVYPTHGVGNVTAIEKTEIAGTQITLYVLNFEKEKMTLRVPVTRAASVGLRRLSSSDQLSKAVSVLKGKPKTARGMWSRRATEYGQKINSGNIEAIAQVVRDLHKNVDDPDRSYSERVIYESAFDRLCGEYAAVNKIDTKQAQEILVKALNKKAA